MVDIKHKKCIKCKKIKPNYNKEGESVPLFCAECKETDMVNITSRKCIKCNIKQPVFNKQGEIKALYCVLCKDPHMIDVKSAKCVKCKTKRSNYNYAGESKALFCFKCKVPSMIDINNRRCKLGMCDKRANFALPGVFPEYCSTHRLDGMIKNPRKKCNITNCKEIATHGLIVSEHCQYHSLSNEYNLAERTCPRCGQIDILNKEGICVNVCSLLEIDTCIKKRKKKHEEYVGRIINENIDTSKILFTWSDKSIDIDCTKQRPDFVFHLGTHVIILEVDEDQHKSYKSCGSSKDEVFTSELRRMYNIGNIFIGIPVFFIRFNPDKFKGKNGEKCLIPSQKRYNTLIKVLKESMDESILLDTSSKIKVKYLFYDGYNESDTKFIPIYEKDVI